MKFTEPVECIRAPGLLLNSETATLQSEATPLLVEQRIAEPKVQETVTFIDAGESEMDFTEAVSFDESYTETNDEVASLGKFLERPVQIGQFQWDETNTFISDVVTLYPWYLYFNSNPIKNKLTNFARIHCNLKLTFRFNASPFYYGAMRVCYDPLVSGKFDSVTSDYDTINMSQMPGVLIEPHISSSAEMTLPFLWPATWLDTTVGSQFQKIGKLLIKPFVPLRSANGVIGTGITVSVYAQATDVQIAGPTASAILQSGIISRPAAAIARFADSLSGVNAIAPYARAASVGARAVSAIASIFGYSNAPITSDVTPVQNKCFHAFANTETRVPIDKLALSPENEITVDNRVAGDIGNDNLVIQDIVMKPAIVSLAEWTTNSSPDALLWAARVTPHCVNSTPGVSQTIYRYTPSGYVAQNFRYWRGGMKYTFRVERSKYHKGRLLVQWDPASRVISKQSETAIHSVIFDLESEDNEFSVDIPYKASQPWLECSPIDPTTDTNSPVSSQHNGGIGLFVLNKLTAPILTSTVTIMVSVQALDDLEFAAPRLLPPFITTATVQSGPVDGSTISYSDRIPEITVGERVGSLRTILHRVNRSFTQVLGLSGSDTEIIPIGMVHTVNVYDRLPPTYGYAGVNQLSNSYHKATSTLASPAVRPFNYCGSHPINWVLAAFAGYRGSVNVHASITTDDAFRPMSTLSLTRIDHRWCDISANNVMRNTAQMSFPARASSQMSASSMDLTGGSVSIPYKVQGGGGMTVTNARTFAGLSANIPQYSRHRFTPNSEVFPDGTIYYDGVRLDADFSSITAITKDTTCPLVDIYYSAGVDFNPVFWTGVPRMFEYVKPQPVTVNGW